MGTSPAYFRRGIATCPRCGKQRYRTRADARAARRILFPGDPMTTYRCGDYYHFGHSDWRERTSDDLVWKPLPPRARAQMHQMARQIGAAA